MKKFCAGLVLVTACVSSALAETEAEVVVPQHGDKYSAFVKSLEAGELAINYIEFRDSFIASKQFALKQDQSAAYESLKKEMYAQMREKNYQELIRIAKRILSIDYTSMMAHKVLHQSYGALGVTVGQKKYHDIEFGLLNSITKNGNGLTCETAWQVVQLEEEFFMLDMMGARRQRQTLRQAPARVCDRMEVRLPNGEQRTFYFGVDKVFSTYKW